MSEAPDPRERRGGVLVLTLNRPAARNSIDDATASGLAAAWEEPAAGPELAIAVPSGTSSCAGIAAKATPALGESFAPSRPICMPEDLTSADAYPASPSAGWITGTEFVIDGGATLGTSPGG